MTALALTSGLYRDCQDQADGHLAVVQNVIRLQEINQHSPNASVVTVKNLASEFKVFSARGLIYEDNDIPALVHAVNSRLGSELKPTVYLDTEGFASPDKDDFIIKNPRRSGQHRDRDFAPTARH